MTRRVSIYLCPVIYNLMAYYAKLFCLAEERREFVRWLIMHYRPTTLRSDSFTPQQFIEGREGKRLMAGLNEEQWYILKHMCAKYGYGYNRVESVLQDLIYTFFTEQHLLEEPVVLLICAR